MQILNAGILSSEEAKERRKEIAKEGEFYGAMDGAAKFVKGDAIAGILDSHHKYNWRINNWFC